MKTLLQISLFFLLFASFSNSQTEWFKHPDNPIISGNPGTWDATYVAFSAVIHDTVYKMWYTGGLNYGTFADSKIGYATSINGIDWNKRPNPVLTKGEAGKFDEGTIVAASVLYDEAIYKMWYVGTHSWFGNNWRIGYATSPDGINWTRQNDGNPVLNLGAAGEWDDAYVGHVSVIRDGSLLKMWYRGSRISGGLDGSIGLATSTDGISWTKFDDPLTTDPPYAESDPVLVPTPGTWDSQVVYHPNVIVNDSTYEMWYVAMGNMIGQNVGYATSSDGINWDKDSSNPVMTIGSAGSFDNFRLLTPCVMFENNLYKMWYTGSNDVTWRIGYATTDPTVDVDEKSNLLPESFTLLQNYPNPFNPSTIISWQSPISSWQTLKVYDLLGKEVAILVDEFKTAGSYEVEFNASQLSSGVYFYTLSTSDPSLSSGQNFNQTKRMVLIK